MLGAVSDAIISSARRVSLGGGGGGGDLARGSGRVSFGGVASTAESKPLKKSAPGSSEELQELASSMDGELELMKSEVQSLTQRVTDMCAEQARMTLKQESMQRELHDTRLQLSKLEGSGGCFGGCFSCCQPKGSRTIDAGLEPPLRQQA